MTARKKASARPAISPGVSPAISPGNPCPFLRALAGEGLIDDDTESLGKVSATIAAVASAGDVGARLPRPAIHAIALVANGLGPLALARNQLHGLRLNQLRGGPLDKKGVGSGILDARSRVDLAQLDRLGEFASRKTDANGRSEPGLDGADLKRMMDANFERAAGRRRRIDRALMDGEWPVLLKVLGKAGQNGPYLSVAEVRALFLQRRLPSRMHKRLRPVG